MLIFVLIFYNVINGKIDFEKNYQPLIFHWRNNKSSNLEENSVLSCFYYSLKVHLHYIIDFDDQFLFSYTIFI